MSDPRRPTRCRPRRRASRRRVERGRPSRPRRAGRADAAAERGAAAARMPRPTALRARRRPPERHRHPFYLRGRRLRLPRSRRGLFALLLVLGGARLRRHVHRRVAHPLDRDRGLLRPLPHDGARAPGLRGRAAPRRRLRRVPRGARHHGLGQGQDQRHARSWSTSSWARSPTPIPPPDHADLPAATDTCKTCHDVEPRGRDGPQDARPQFTEDEANTRQFVGLMIRPGGGNPFDVNRSVHWHVAAQRHLLHARRERARRSTT